MKGGEEMIKRILIFSLAVIMTMSIAMNPVYAEDDAEKVENDTQTAETQRHSKGKREKKQETVEPEDAIGKDAAKSKALADVGLTADQIKKIRARVSETEDGTIIYKVGFVFEGQKYSYQIDALNGTIISKSNKNFTAKASKDLNGKVKSAGKQKDKDLENSSSDQSL